MDTAGPETSSFGVTTPNYNAYCWVAGLQGSDKAVERVTVKTHQLLLQNTGLPRCLSRCQCDDSDYMQTSADLVVLRRLVNYFAQGKLQRGSYQRLPSAPEG